MDCYEQLDTQIDGLTQAQKDEISEEMEKSINSPAKFAKWIIKKLKEWLE